MTGSEVPTVYNTQYVDWRYFHVEDMRGSASSLLARSILTSCMRADLELSRFGTVAWELALVSSGPENRAVQGFLAEQLLLVDIAERGLPAMGAGWEGQFKPEIFQSITPTLPISRKPVKILYIPSTANYKAIDAILYMTQKDLQNKGQMVATIAPLQITIADRHSDSEAKFFPAWDSYERQLSKMGYLSQQHIIFLWIYETIQTIPVDRRSIGTVERNERMHKERVVLVNPEFDRRLVPIGAVSKRISELLDDARGVSGIKSKGKARATTTTTIAATHDDELDGTAQVKVPDVQMQPNVDIASDLTPQPPPVRPKPATRSGQPPSSAAKKPRGKRSALGSSKDAAV